MFVSIPATLHSLIHVSLHVFWIRLHRFRLHRLSVCKTLRQRIEARVSLKAGHARLLVHVFLVHAANIGSVSTSLAPSCIPTSHVGIAQRMLLPAVVSVASVSGPVTAKIAFHTHRVCGVWWCGGVCVVCVMCGVCCVCVCFSFLLQTTKNKKKHCCVDGHV